MTLVSAGDVKEWNSRVGPSVYIMLGERKAGEKASYYTLYQN